MAEAALLRALGELKRYQWDWPAAATFQESACRLYAGLGDARGEAGARAHPGDVYRLQGKLDEARKALELALGAYQARGDSENEVSLNREYSHSRPFCCTC
ncbi:MAG: hypothetical protein GX597_05320 [Anaerolineaceae bacterium]|nr:hypothetical protein [Anaerolineaceae bacterium]